MTAESTQLASSVPADSPRQERFPGLVWLRAIGALLVVALHAGMPYLTHPLPGLIWSADSDVKSAWVTATVWTIDGFIMPLFFLMSGFLAAQLFSQKSPNEFLKHRWSRLGYPFLFAMVALMPADLNIWITGWIGEEWVPWRKIISLKFAPPYSESIWGVGHLWYLQYLIAYCTAAWLIDKWARRGAVQQDNEGTTSIWHRLPAASGPVLLTAGILIAATVLWWQPRIVIGFRHSWWPLWENLIYYSVPFSLGWCWQRQQLTANKGGLPTIVLLLASISCGIALMPLLQNHLEQETAPCANPMLTVLWAGFGLLFSSALFKFSLAWKSTHVPKSIVYIANASFWIYLIHHPLAGLINISLDRIDWNPFLEFVLTTALAVVLCLMTYEVGVRRTWIGTLFTGRKEPHSSAPTKPASEGPSTTLSANHFSHIHDVPENSMVVPEKELKAVPSSGNPV